MPLHLRQTAAKFKNAGDLETTACRWHAGAMKARGTPAMLRLFAALPARFAMPPASGDPMGGLSLRF